MQPTTQPTYLPSPPVKRRRGPGVPFQKGDARINRSGIPRTERIYRETLALFEAAHSRQPNRVDITNLRSYAAISARLEGNRLPATEMVRCENVRGRLLAKLGLDTKPAPAAPKSPVQTLEEACALIREGAK